MSILGRKFCVVKTDLQTLLKGLVDSKNLEKWIGSNSNKMEEIFNMASTKLDVQKRISHVCLVVMC